MVALPATVEDLARWELTKLVHRVATGRWQSDLEARVLRAIGPKRKEAWKVTDRSANLLRQVYLSLAKLYDVEPVISHPDAAARAHIERLSQSGYWPMMQAYMAEILALRESLVRVDIEPNLWTGQPELTYRVVYPYEVTARCLASRPDRPVAISELRERTINGKQVWAWDVLSLIDDLGRPIPSYRVVLQEDGRDVTREVLGGDFSGETYPYRDARGVPFLPYVLYRAQKTGQMWNVWHSSEVVEGTINVGVKYSFLQHVELQAAWAQRYGVDVVHPEAEWMDEDSDGHGRSSVVTDPTKIEMFHSRDDGRNPHLGAFPVPISPLDMIQEISMYERRLVATLGIETPEGIRASGDPRSGYAVAVSRDAQREAQRKYEPTFSEADRELLRIAAALWNRATGERVPEEGYHVQYVGIPLSAEERRAQREHLRDMLEAGLMDEVEAYQELHPGVSEEEALERLLLHARRRARLAAARQAQEEPEEVEAEPEEPAEEPEAEAEEGGLTGSQMSAALEVCDRLAQGTLTTGAAEILLAELGMEPEHARRLAESVPRIPDAPDGGEE